jgi:ATP-dependent RNA helicase MSS116
LKATLSLGRLYSTEAAATEEPASPSIPNGPVELFSDLSALGVHRSLIDAITRDMKYERMTPVQAKTINPALKGTDMYAFTVPHLSWTY